MFSQHKPAYTCTHAHIHVHTALRVCTFGEDLYINYDETVNDRKISFVVLIVGDKSTKSKSYSLVKYMCTCIKVCAILRIHV